MPPSPDAIAQLIQQAIDQAAALQSTQTGWQVAKLQQTHTFLTTALESMQTIANADPEWEALLREPALSTDDRRP